MFTLLTISLFILESSKSGPGGGCFWEGSKVRTLERGTVPISDVRTGEHVESVTYSNQVTYSQVLLLLDSSVSTGRTFVNLTTTSHQNLVVTPSHLIFTMNDDNSMEAVFASNLKTGQKIVTTSNSSKTVTDTVKSVELVFKRGFYAPLTRNGKIVVNDIVASCYAVIQSQDIAHWSFLPVRLGWNAKEWWLSLSKWLQWGQLFNYKLSTPNLPPSEGVHWYARLLYWLAQYVIPESYLYH